MEESGKKWERILNFAIGYRSPIKVVKMVKFIGEYVAKLDEKGRVVVPAAFKNIVGKHSEGGEVSFVIKKDLFANCLNMFTYEQWDQESEQVRSRLNLFRREDAAWYREYMMDRALVTLDQKVGRIIIPKNLLAKSNHIAVNNRLFANCALVPCVYHSLEAFSGCLELALGRTAGKVVDHELGAVVTSCIQDIA